MVVMASFMMMAIFMMIFMVITVKISVLVQMINEAGVIVARAIFVMMM